MISRAFNWSQEASNHDVRLIQLAQIGNVCARQEKSWGRIFIDRLRVLQIGRADLMLGVPPKELHDASNSNAEDAVFALKTK